jgi:hypothetical protein
VKLTHLIAAAAVSLLLLAPVAHAQTTAAPVVAAAPASDTTTIINAPAGQPVTIAKDDSTTTVVVPVGTWVEQVLAAVQSSLAVIIAAVVAWAFRNLPKSVVSILRTLQIEQVLTRAADYGISATRGAVKGKTLDVNVGNEAVAKAVQYAVDNAPRWLIDWAGGPEAIKDKIIARIPLGEDVGKSDIR